MAPTWGCHDFMAFKDKSLEEGEIMLQTKPQQLHMIRSTEPLGITKAEGKH